MLTRNFMYLLANNRAMLIRNNDSMYKDTSGRTGFPIHFGTTDDAYTPFIDGRWKKSFISIGTGTTPVKMTDYKLENAISSGYVCSELQKSMIEMEDKDLININAVITNTSSEDITFSEIGWFVSAADFYVMLAREVYDTPITIAPGESVAVNVNII